MSAGPIPAPASSTDCFPEIGQDSTTEFELVNTHPSKAKSTFIYGQLLSGGTLFFVVENLPKRTPPTGCPGKWMFQQMMADFGAQVLAIKTDWHGSTPGKSDNLDEINKRTTGGAITVLEAAWFTWTGNRAKEWGAANVAELVPCVGAPGKYVQVQLIFTK